MIFIYLILGLFLGIIITSYVDYMYVKKVCEKCNMDFKNLKHFYKMKSQKCRHKKVKDCEKSRK